MQDIVVKFQLLRSPPHDAIACDDAKLIDEKNAFCPTPLPLQLTYKPQRQ